MNLKVLAAEKALEYVKSDMVLGLGSGSTAAEFVKLLGEKVVNGELSGIIGVPTSNVTSDLAKDVGITVSSLDEHDRLDLAVDGADEVDPDLNLIKGLGRALLREKMTEINAEKFVVVVDDSKMVSKLGIKGPLPVEIVPFGAVATARWLDSLEGCRAEYWTSEDGSPAKTDNGNHLVKCWFDDGISDPEKLASVLEGRPGVVEHGLFLGMATAVVVAGEDGVEVIER